MKCLSSRMRRTGIINEKILENECSVEKMQKTGSFYTKNVVPRIQGSQMCEPVYQLCLVGTKRNCNFSGFT